MRQTVSKADQAARTRTVLLSAGRELFADQGYAKTSTESIVKRTGMTRGALYHHFQNKAGLFQAVYEELRASVLQRVVERIQTAKGDLWQRLIQTGLRTFLEIASEPKTQRILYVDGPAILPPTIWHDNTAAVAAIQNVLEQLAAAGLIEQQPFGTLARLLWGALLEAALHVSYTGDGNAVQEEVFLGMEQLVAGLRIKPVSRAEGN